MKPKSKQRQKREDWDFSEVTEDELAATISAEYYLSCEPFIRAVQEWKEHQITVFGKSASIDEHLKTAWDSRIQAEEDWLALSAEDREGRISPFLPGDLGPYLRNVMGIVSARLPQSFATLPALVKCALLYEHGDGHIDLPKFAASETANIEATFKPVEETSSVFARHFRVDFLRFSPAEIKKAFSEWVDSEVEASKGGTAEKTPWFKLRWLAAYRLGQRFKRFEDAQRFISEYSARLRIDDVHGVLPKYTTSKDWSRAKANARQILEAIGAPFLLYPLPPVQLREMQESD